MRRPRLAVPGGRSRGRGHRLCLCDPVPRPAGLRLDLREQHLPPSRSLRPGRRYAAARRADRGGGRRRVSPDDRGDRRRRAGLRGASRQGRLRRDRPDAVGRAQIRPLARHALHAKAARRRGRDPAGGRGMSEAISRRLAAEGIGSFFLFAAVIGSGVMAEALAGGNVAIALLGNTLATGAILFVLIAMLGPVSGAHFNPAVSLVMAARRELRWRDAFVYILAQLIGGLLGAWAAHLMFDLPILQYSVKARTGIGQWSGELVATFGLILTILGTLRHRPAAVPASVALYITAAYWFTSSTSFANPAITVVRSLSDSFAGIAPGDVPAFVVAQLVGAFIAAALARWLFAD